MGIGNRIALIAAITSFGAAPARAAAIDIPTAPPPIIQIGSAYIAKQMCSCLFVAGRSEASCRPEFKGQSISAFIVIADRSRLPQRATLTATLGKVSAQARYTHRFGCSIAR